LLYIKFFKIKINEIIKSLLVLNVYMFLPTRNNAKLREINVEPKPYELVAWYFYTT